MKQLTSSLEAEQNKSKLMEQQLGTLQKAHANLQEKYDRLFEENKRKFETKAEQAHQGQIQDLLFRIDDLEKEKAKLEETCAALSGEHPQFNLPLELTDLDVMRTKRSEVKHEAMYKQCINEAFARPENRSLQQVCT